MSDAVDSADNTGGISIERGADVREKLPEGARRAEGVCFCSRVILWSYTETYCFDESVVKLTEGILVFVRTSIKFLSDCISCFVVNFN